MRRRDVFPLLALLAGGPQPPPPASGGGRLKQTVTRGVFGRGMNFEASCQEAARLGIKGYDLIGPADWPMLKKYGLIPTMYSFPGSTIPDGLNTIANHAALEKSMNAAIDEAAANGVP